MSSSKHRNRGQDARPEKNYLRPEQKIRLASLALRVGLAFVFLYAATEALLHPEAWIGYIPHSISNIVDAKVMLDSISAAQFILAAWLLWGRFSRYAGLLAVVLLGGITLSNLGALLITFRDIGLIGAALAVSVLDC